MPEKEEKKMKIVDLINHSLASNTQLEKAQRMMQSWQSWYNGYVQDFHTYHIYNGTSRVQMRMNSLQMAKKVCEDWADLLFNERVLISVDNDKTNERLQKILQEMNFETIVNEGVEQAFAMGTVGFVINVSKDNDISLESVNGLKVYPIAVQNKRVTECAFISNIMIKGKEYAYITIHQKPDDTYVIENALYELKEGGSEEISGTPADYWVYNTGSDVPWFSIFRPNAVNNILQGSPFGLSVFANAIAELKNIDNTYDAMNNEISIGRMRIVAASDAFRYDEGTQKPVFDPKEIAFYSVPKSMNDQPFIEAIAPTLRTPQQEIALNKSLSLLSQACGFSANYYEMKEGQLRTATEVISADSKMYRRMVKHEIPLEETVRNLVTCILDIYSRVKKESLPYSEITIQFDDSIIQDKDSERQQDNKDIMLGIMSRVEYRMKWYGEDEETAKAKVEEAKAEDVYGHAEGE